MPSHVPTAVRDLRPGDLVDLEADPYADRPCADGCEDCDLARSTFAYEYVQVHELEPETADCLVVFFDGHAVGFPPDHRVPVMATPPVHPIREHPVISHLGDGEWGSLCERCGERLVARTPGGVASEHAVHTTMNHNVADQRTS